MTNLDEINGINRPFVIPLFYRVVIEYRSKIIVDLKGTAMKKPLTRREFLRLAATGAGTLALSELLSACGVETTSTPASLPPTDPPTETISATATDTPGLPTETPQETEIILDQPTDTQEPTETPTVVPQPDIVVVRNGEPEEMVRKAIDALGGMSNYISSGDDVIIKPNICVDFRDYQWAATTNPWIVGALVKMSYEAGASRVRVMDQTWKRNMTKAYRQSGIQEQVEAAGGEMEWMPLEKFIPCAAPQGVELTSFDVYDEIMNADVLINVPVAKHHMDAKLTLAMKNLMGVIRDRPIIHKNFGQRIADLASVIRPTLNVMDAVRVMMKNGPIGYFLADTKQMNTIIACEDMVAIDSYTTQLFNMKPTDLDYVVCAAEMGIGRHDIENLKVEEINIG
jgi:uncharacterized protein (DUF362 family)